LLLSSYKLLEGCFLRKSLVATKNIDRNKGKITKMGNSGTVGVGLGEAEVELSGMVTVCVLLQALSLTKFTTIR